MRSERKMPLGPGRGENREVGKAERLRGKRTGEKGEGM